MIQRTEHALIVATADINAERCWHCVIRGLKSVPVPDLLAAAAAATARLTNKEGPTVTVRAEYLVVCTYRELSNRQTPKSIFLGFKKYLSLVCYSCYTLVCMNCMLEHCVNLGADSDQLGIAQLLRFLTNLDLSATPGTIILGMT